MEATVRTNETASPAAGNASARLNWRQVGLFVGLTLGLTWLLNLALWQTIGLANPAAGIAMQFQMLIPALCAIALGLFAFRDSPINLSVNRGRTRWFFFLFLAYALAYAALAVVLIASPKLVGSLAGIGLLLTVAMLVVAIVVRVVSGREASARVGLAFGKARYWLIFGVGFVLYYVAQTGLNYAFGLGRVPDIAPLAQQVGLPPDAFLAAAAVQTVLVGPFLGLAIAFGEEYGWRGYLQSELVKIGRVRGIFLVGVIWGIWHAPVIAMGHNYPGYPVFGPLLFTVYTVLLAFVLGYAVLKTGSIWLAAFLHALNNQVYSFLIMMVYAPSDPVFSFGAGIYGVATLAVVVLLILRDPLWRQRTHPPAA